MGGEAVGQRQPRAAAQEKASLILSSEDATRLKSLLARAATAAAGTDGQRPRHLRGDVRVMTIVDVRDAIAEAQRLISSAGKGTGTLSGVVRGDSSDSHLAQDFAEGHA